MTFSRLLIDNDLFILLSGCGLLEDLLRALGFRFDQCLRLPQLPHVIRKSRSIRLQYSTEVRAAAILACEAFAALDDEVDHSAVDRLQAARGVEPDAIIDGGEAILFDALIRRTDTLLLTGDKRAIRVLATVPSLADLREKVAGRVICLETVFSLLVEDLGPSAVAERLKAVPHHKTARIVFSPGVLAVPGDLENAIASYFGQLRDEVGIDFLFDS